MFSFSLFPHLNQEVTNTEIVYVCLAQYFSNLFDQRKLLFFLAISHGHNRKRKYFFLSNYTHTGQNIGIYNTLSMKRKI